MYTIQNILKKNKDLFGNDYYIFEKRNKTFHGKTYCQFVDDVYKFASFLQQQNLIGKKIAIYSKNSYEYMVADAAIMGFVGVSVCISKEWMVHDLKVVMEQIDIDAIIYGEDQEENIVKLKSYFPNIIFIHSNMVVECKPTQMCKYDLIDPMKCSKIIFSSGTTGMPKAVMLSQHNMFACWENLCRRAPINHTDVNYLFLPLHHAYAGICNFLYSLISGMQIYLCSSVANIMEELQQVKPTVFCAVPLIFERIYTFCKEHNISPSMVFGDNMKHLFCGGAWFNPEIREFFESNGINIMNSYGLSETSSLICLEYHNSKDYDTVGQVLENMVVKISNPDDNGIGEILAKGDNVFLGYYNNPEATSRAFDDGGFFHTGDLGRLENNKLYHCGRIKKVIVLSNGENVYPDEIASLLVKHSGVVSAKVYEKDKKISATIFCNEEINSNKIVEHVNNQLPRYSHIQEVEVVKDSISVRMK